MVIERQNKKAGVDIEQAREAVGEFFSQNDYAGKRILILIPDNTRSGPIGEIFKIIYELLGPKAQAVDSPIPRAAPVTMATLSLKSNSLTPSFQFVFL